MWTQTRGRSKTVGIRNSWEAQSCWAAAILQALRACTVLMTLFRAEYGAKTVRHAPSTAGSSALSAPHPKPQQQILSRMHLPQADEAIRAMMYQFYLMDRAAEAGKHAVDSKMLRSALSKYQKGAFKNGELQHAHYSAVPRKLAALLQGAQGCVHPAGS